MKRIIFILITGLLLVPSWVFAQNFTVVAQLDSTIIKIGEQTHLTFKVTQMPNQKVIMPIFSDTIGGLELVEPLKIDTTKTNDGKITVTQHYLVTSFHDSLLYVQPYPFVSGKDTVWSKSLSIKVVQPFKIDTTTQKIADIKPVLSPPFNWARLLTVFLLGLVIVAILLISWYLYQRYFKKKTLMDQKEAELLLPPHVVAINHLDRIKQEKLWQQGRLKEYHTDLTEVVRVYIERVFNVNSLEMTSEEILDHLRFMKVDQLSAFQSLQQILTLADLVKFAKFEPLSSENELSLMNGYLFVNQTKVEETSPAEEFKEKEEQIKHEDVENA